MFAQQTEAGPQNCKHSFIQVPGFSLYVQIFPCCGPLYQVGSQQALDQKYCHPQEARKDTKRKLELQREGFLIAAVAIEHSYHQHGAKGRKRKKKYHNLFLLHLQKLPTKTCIVFWIGPSWNNKNACCGVPRGQGAVSRTEKDREWIVQARSQHILAPLLDSSLPIGLISFQSCKVFSQYQKISSSILPQAWHRLISSSSTLFPSVFTLQLKIIPLPSPESLFWLLPLLNLDEVPLLQSLIMPGSFLQWHLSQFVIMQSHGII